MFGLTRMFSRLLDRICMAIYRRGERAWVKSPERAALLASSEWAAQRQRARAEVHADCQILRHRPSDGPVPDREQLIADWLLWDVQAASTPRHGMRAQ